MDSGANSVASSPRSDHPATEFQPRMRFMCSSGGKILPRPHDNQLRYVGGDTRIVAVNRNTSFSALISKLSKLSGIANVTVKYQLPNEDLDALISVTTDEDVENMMEEYDRLAQNQNPRSARLRLFLFPKGEEFSFSSRTSSISSLLDGSANRGQWFVDALNAGGAGLERGRSEASSILSEVPDYLFGLDNNSDESHARDAKPKPRSAAALNDNVSASDPGSPAPVVSSPYGSTSSVSGVAVMPNLPPVRTKPENPVQSHETDQVGLTEPTIAQTGGYPGQTMWRYPTPVTNYPGPAVQQMPVYYVQSPVQGGNMQVQQQMPVQAQYVPQYQAQPGQVPVGYGQAVMGMGQGYGGPMRPAFDPYNMGARVGPDGVGPPVYYGVRNPGLAPGYSGLVGPGGEDMQGANVDPKPVRFNQPS